MIFVWGVFGGFFGGLFPWKRTGGKIQPKNSQQNSNRNLGDSRPKSTLQGSGLDTKCTVKMIIMSAREGNLKQRCHNRNIVTQKSPLSTITASDLSFQLRWAKSPIASVQPTRSALASHSAIPRGTTVKRLNANRAIRIATQRTQRL